MQIKPSPRSRSEAGYILAYYVLLLILVAAVAGLCTVVTSSVGISHRRADIVQSTYFAEAGAVLACTEVEKAFTNSASPSFFVNLTGNAAGAYNLDPTLSKAGQVVYKRTITAPFSNQTVTAQVWLTNAVNPTAATVVGIAKVGNVSQMATVHLGMTFQFGAAIISDSPGTTSPGVTKAVGQQGNVIVTGDKGITVIDGGTGPAILANGMVNTGSGGTVILNTNAVSMTNYGTANEVPDYTNPGSTDQLFDFNRYIAVADKSGTHFPNVNALIAKAKAGTVLEGVIAVDISSKELATDLTPLDLPLGLNIRGTLLCNFAADVGPLDKIRVSAAFNINPANLAMLNATNPLTYTSGYPPVYANPAKNPINVNISTLGFQNFTVGDDLPALMYNQGFVDLHGPLNICGVVYSPSFIELDYQPVPVTQYIRGAIITGGGVFLDNNVAGNTIVVSFDFRTLDRLATSGSKGKGVKTLYWE